MEIPRYAEFEGLMLLDYLAVLWPDRSRRVLEGLFASGRIRSADRPVSPRRLLGDVVDLSLAGSLEDVERIPVDPFPTGEKGDGTQSRVRILEEDSRLVALDKPSGVPVVPDRRAGGESCLGFLIRRELEARSSKPPADFLRYRIVHRIDRLTSGLVLVARTPRTERELAADFEARRISKEYLALLSGSVSPARLRVDCPIVPGRKGKMRAGTGPELKPRWPERSAVTEFEVLERLGDTTLVRARPQTGRTHQIRVHAWVTGHPLAVDPLYGRGKGRWQPERVPGLERLSLHALRVTLPSTWEEPRTFECPLAPDFEEALRRLRG